jgi:hypothetical protein
MITARAYDIFVESLFERMRRFHSALSQAGIPYRIVGGMAVFYHVSERDHDKARFTRDVDAAVRREDLDRVIAAAESVGFRHRHMAGIERTACSWRCARLSDDMLLDPVSPGARSAIHLVFAHERFRPDDFEAVPFSEPYLTSEGILLAPIADLVRMKLTSFRLKDKVHIQDMDSVGLITSEIEDSLPDWMRERLREVRAME